MRVITSVKQMTLQAIRWERKGRRIGFVPTMGALHEGHASLIRAAVAKSDRTVVSIFVNPLQFGAAEDFTRYPRTPSADLALLRRCGVDAAFCPSREAMYPGGHSTTIDVGDLARRWEGKSRPGHFAGVATIVGMLFEVVRPAAAYFGQKDYQQTLVIKRLVEDLKILTRVEVLPTVREADGVAMSSRNRYLSPSLRRQAPVLHQALEAGAADIRRGERSAARVVAAMRQVIGRAPDARIDYVAAVDARTLEARSALSGTIVLLEAVRLGRTRLIDNRVVTVP